MKIWKSLIAGCLLVLLQSLTIGTVGAQSAAPGIDEENKVVTVGAFTPVTGPVPFYTQLTDAANAYFQQVNDAGGIDGWTIEFITLDDGYDPSRSVSTARRLVEEHDIFALAASVGTATNVAVIPYAKDQKLPMVGPVGGSSKFYREPLVFPLLPDYGWSAASNARYALDELGAERLALLWENDELGRSARRGIETYLKSREDELAASVSFGVETTDFSPHVQRLRNANVDAVILFGSNAHLAGALRAANNIGLDADWFGPFFTADPSTYQLAGDLLDGTYFSSWLLPVSSDDPEIVAYREGLQEYYPDNATGVFGLNGWSHGALFVKAFERLLESGRGLTRDNLLAVLNQFRDVQVGGARVTYEEGDHRGTRREAILQARDGDFVLVQEFHPYPDVVFNADQSE